MAESEWIDSGAMKPHNLLSVLVALWLAVIAVTTTHIVLRCVRHDRMHHLLYGQQYDLSVWAQLGPKQLQLSQNLL